MKHIITIVLTLLPTAFAMTQERSYISVCGKTKIATEWTEGHKDEKIYLCTIQGGEKYEYILGNDYKTGSWKIVNASSNTNLSIRLDNDIYSIFGKFNEKQISRVVKSKGEPRYQGTVYNAGLILRSSESVECGCFHPDNMKLHTASTANKGPEKLDGENAIRIEVTLTSFMSASWSCDYYFDTSSTMLVGYKGVSGAPGTPETKILVAR